MQRKINFEVIRIKKKMEPMQLLVIAISCHRLRERRPSDQNISKHENSYSELGGLCSHQNLVILLSLLREADDLKILS